jgi:choline dehydrogenase-like flavoprotein
MVRGLETLGWHVDRMPRNVRGCSQEDECGYCIYGCQTGAKQSTLITYLQDAADCGARMVVNCSADAILTERGRAAGVVATVTGQNGGNYNLVVKAKAVVVACGSLHTPALLLRSGLGGPAVGKNLHLHPVTAVVGRMEEEVRPWTGVMQAAYSRQFADLDGNGYGAILETAPGHMATPAFVFGWQNGRKFKELVGNLKNLAYIGILLRDYNGGEVNINRKGQPVYHYRLSRPDIANMRIALQGAVRILRAAGAKEIFSSNQIPASFIPGKPGQSISKLMSEIDRQGWGSNQMTYISFHQMGSCRMGSNPATSVVNQHNEVHNTPGLFIADASVFPTASGVNPMITIETIAHRAACYIKSTL